MKVLTKLPKEAARESNAGVEIFKHLHDGELYYKDKLNQLVPLDTTSDAEGLNATLAVSNTTSGLNMEVTYGDNIELISSDGFRHRLSMPIGATGSNQTITFQATGGEVAYTSDIAANNELSEILGNGNTTSGNNIVMTTTDKIDFNAGAQLIGYNQLGYGTVDLVVAAATQGFAAGTVGGDVVSISPLGMTMLHLASMPSIALLGVAGSTGGTLIPDLASSGETWTLPNGTGTLALTSDIVADSLATSLAGGITSGAFNISMDNSQQIQATNGGGMIDMRYGDVDGQVAITSDGNVFTTSYMYISKTQFDIKAEDTGGNGSIGTAANMSIAAGTTLDLDGADVTIDAATSITFEEGAKSFTLGTVGGVLAITADIEGGFTLDDAANIVLDTTTGTKIGTATSQKLGFFNATPVVQQTALTTALTTLTVTAPSVADYTLQDMTNSSPWGFADGEELRTFTTVVVNNQDRINDLETKLQALGLIA
jgi:hypothetical protein